MSATITMDLREFNDGISKLMSMGDVRRRDIAAIYRRASRPLIASIQKHIPISEEGTIYSRYQSRTHPRGFLRKSMKFKVSRKYRLVYFVFPAAWYAQIAIMRTKGSNPGTAKGSDSAYMGRWGWRKSKKIGTYKGKKENEFVDKGERSSGSMVINEISRGLSSLIDKTWSYGG